MLFQSLTPLSPIAKNTFLTWSANPNFLPCSATAFVNLPLPTATLKPTYAAASAVPIPAAIFAFLLSF